MNSFLIGTVLDPEVRNVKTKNGACRCVSFGLLSGRVAISFDVWDDSKIFGKVFELVDGETVCAIVYWSPCQDQLFKNYREQL